jgi:adenosine kinase
VTTRSEAGISLRRYGAPAIEVDVVPADVVLDPTGVGDAFRSGFLAGVSAGLDLRRSAMTGAALATTVIETIGTQEYEFEPRRFATRIASTYGDGAAAAICRALRIDIPAAQLETTR